MEMEFVGAFKIEYGWMVDSSRIILQYTRSHPKSRESKLQGGVP